MGDKKPDRIYFEKSFDSVESFLSIHGYYLPESIDDPQKSCDSYGVFSRDYKFQVGKIYRQGYLELSLDSLNSRVALVIRKSLEKALSCILPEIKEKRIRSFGKESNLTIFQVPGKLPRSS